jgi:hypothetical protein
MPDAIDLGTLTFTIPYYLDLSGNTESIDQDYINFYDSGDYRYGITTTGQSPTYTGYTGNTSFSYLGIGSSRFSEKRRYGTPSYIYGTDYTTGTTTDGIVFSAYTFNYTGATMTGATLYYRDFEDGFTLITGTTHGFKKEDVINYTLTRNEHFLGFVEQPTVYSNVFIERSKQGVMEKNLRLGEIDNVGELSVYGNGFFKIKKQ